MATVSVRYIVDDVDAAIEFYCQQLGFHEEMHPASSFAMLSRGDLRLVLSAPGGGPGGGQAMPDGRMPEPGGWNRFQLEVPDLAATVQALRERGARFRNEIVIGVGGKQILVEDPSGNPIEGVRDADGCDGWRPDHWRVLTPSRRSSLISFLLWIGSRG